MLKYRLISAVILIPLLFWAIWALPVLYFSLLVALLIALSAWEWSALMGFFEKYLRLLYVVVVLLGLYFVKSLPTFPVLLFGLLIWLWALTALIQYQRGRSPMGFQFPEIQAMVGFFILVFCWLALMDLRLGAGAFGPIRLMLCLVFIFAADTGAYFSGRFWGKRALASRLSPKKTWEGLVGGLVLTLLVAVIASFYMPMSLTQKIILCVLALVVAIFSVIGDLTVSLLKRQSGVKDAGCLIPGHGGLLDRMDSVMAGVLVFALGLRFF